MGKFVDSVMSGECFIPPSKTKVLQFFDAEGIIRGECFEFSGKPKPKMEEFKKDLLKVCGRLELLSKIIT